MVTWRGNNRKHFESLGYTYTKQGDSFIINVEDLSKGSNFKVDVQCDYCGSIEKRMFAHAYKSKVHQCEECKDRKLEKECESCKQIFEVPLYDFERRKTCSKKCLGEYKQDKIKCNCFICNKDIFKTRSQIGNSKSGKVFCSNLCVGKYNAATRINKISKQCLVCEAPYDTIPSLAEKSVTCSVECQKKWQSLYLVGEKANNYKSIITSEMRKHNCDWCGTEYDLTSPHKVKQRDAGEKSLFCSKDCYREWYAKEWSQQKDWKEQSRIRAVKMLENGSFNHTDTECQIAVDNILNELKIEYQNEYNCKYYSIDNYLTSHNLMIEVMGTYWHTDPRKYNEVKYQLQVDRIKNDKAKKTYIENSFNIKILYLWEMDIIENPELCTLLIKEYIESNGNLGNYHSFNFFLNDKSLTIKNELIIPYSEYDILELREKIKIADNKKRSKKQMDKWTIFNCDFCGKEKEQLTSYYVKSKSHCCSVACASEHRKRK